MPRFLEERRSDTYGGKLRIMEHLELRQESGGSRLYLMDKPIHAGDCLEVLISEKWFPARCECYREKGNFNWYLIVFKPEGEDVIEDCNSVLCRFS
ncbi:DUF5348 domain-containing protein [Nostoc sp. CHAB 5784]|uniref:DUF5348 domain-containing protein n=1 Tax=Nostoc mirabile TaxID=2907820 RepID=UPI001E40CCBE|nr:DUF5348 domain-containing protein [Nostoc mirabile]MCC5667785.1 DUF5348 domain-containing protein [Nostoc mirabile CHAB5784]